VYIKIQPVFSARVRSLLIRKGFLLQERNRAFSLTLASRWMFGLLHVYDVKKPS